MVPARRRLLMSFQGQLKPGHVAPELDQFVVSQLQGFLSSKTTDKFLLEFECPDEMAASSTVHSTPTEWIPCGTEASRASVLKASTYALLLAPTDLDTAATPLLLARLAESLKHGAIPVLLGDHLRLPFSETILWRRAVLHLPKVSFFL
jgi:alpha-1,4-N-acetylglucosaminyltransferase EXTL3